MEKYLKYLKQILIFLLIFLIQSCFITKWRIFGIAPDLILAYIIIMALTYNVAEAAAFAILAGILTDILSSVFFGFNTFIFLYMSVGIYLLGHKYIRGSQWLAFLFVIAGSIVYSIVFYIVVCFTGGAGNFWIYLLKNCIFFGIYTAVASFPIVIYFDKWIFRFADR